MKKITDLEVFKGSLNGENETGALNGCDVIPKLNMGESRITDFKLSVSAGDISVATISYVDENRGPCKKEILLSKLNLDFEGYEMTDCIMTEESKQIKANQRGKLNG